MKKGHRFILETDRDSSSGGILVAEDGFEVEGAGPKPEIPRQGVSGAHMLEPVSFVVVVSALSILAHRIIEHFLRQGEHGVLIDARKTPAVISSISGVPNGFVVTIGPDGTAETHNVSAMKTPQLTQILKKAIESVGTTE